MLFVDAMIGVVNLLNTSVAIRIMRIKVQRERQRLQGVLRDIQDLTVTYMYIIYYIYIYYII